MTQGHLRSAQTPSGAQGRPRCPSAAPCPHLPPSRDLVRTPRPMRSRSLSLSSHCSRDPRSWHQPGPRLPSLPSPRLWFPGPRSAPEALASFFRLDMQWPMGTLSPPPTRRPPRLAALASRRAPASLTETPGPFQSSCRLLAATRCARTPASPAAATACPSQSEVSSPDSIYVREGGGCGHPQRGAHWLGRGAFPVRGGARSSWAT